MRVALSLSLLAVLVLGATLAVAGDPAPKKEAGKAAVEVPFPKDWRSLDHVKSMAIVDAKHPLFGAFGGMHHVYANAAAKEALQKKAAFPDGAVLVFDLLEATADNGAYVEGKRKIVATMVRDSKKYADTAGWGFQGWAEGDASKPALKTAAEQTSCKACHDQVAATGHVFSAWRP